MNTNILIELLLSQALLTDILANRSHHNGFCKALILSDSQRSIRLKVNVVKFSRFPLVSERLQKHSADMIVNIASQKKTFVCDHFSISTDVPIPVINTTNRSSS